MLDHEETQVLQAQRVLLAPRVPPGYRGRLAQQVRQAQRAMLALRVSQVPRD